MILQQFPRIFQNGEDSVMKRKITYYGICCVFVFGLMVDRGFAQVNLLTDPAMESWSGSDLINWTKENVNLEQESVIKHGGTYSAKLQRKTQNRGIYQIVPVTEGHYYTFKVWLYDSGVNSKIGIFVNWRNGESDYLSRTGIQYATMEGSWQYVSIDNKLAPISAAQAECKIRVYVDEDDSDYCYADDALFYDDVSLPVIMGALSAEKKGEAVVIRWSTESEVDLRGFNVLRAEEEDGEYCKMNTAFIMAQGNHSSQSQYVYYDQTVLPGRGYWYQIEMVYVDGHRELSERIYSNVFTGNIDIEKSVLCSNYPNPFNPETTIRYRISREDSFDQTSLKIYNMMGQEVLTLVNRYHDPGEYTIKWNGCDTHAVPVPSGIYFYRLLSGSMNVDMKRMIKMK